MKYSAYNKIPENKELVTVLPMAFKVNDEVVNNPLNMISEALSIKSVLVSVPRKNFQGIMNSLKHINVELVDVVISPLADYYQAKTKETNKDRKSVV